MLALLIVRKDRNAEEDVRAALIQLAAQFAILNEKLEQSMARRQRHLPDFANVPRTDDVPPAVGIFFDLRDDLVNLVDRAAVGGAPVAPLRAIDAAQITIAVGQFIPDRHAVLVEILGIGVAAQEPEQLVDDRFEVEFFGGQHRKTISQRKSRLCAEDRIRSGARAVVFEFPAFQHQAQELMILNHKIKPKSSVWTADGLMKSERNAKFYRAWEVTARLSSSAGGILNRSNCSAN